MHNSKSAENRGGFLLAAPTTFLVVLGTVALLNYWADPFSRFEQPKRPGVTENRSTAFLLADRDQQMRWMLFQARSIDRNTHTVLIGSSQLLYGMNTCSLPHLQRLALGRLLSSEIAQVVTASIPHLAGPETFLIQIVPSGATTSLRSEGKAVTLWRGLLAWQTTTVSLANLWASHLSSACAAMERPPRSFAVLFDPKRISLQLESAAIQLDDGSGVDEILDAIVPECQRFHHTIVLFTLPVFFTRATAPALLSILNHRICATRRAAESFTNQASGCRVIISDLATTYTVKHVAVGAPPQEWYDVAHFKPALGQELLKLIVSAETRPE